MKTDPSMINMAAILKFLLLHIFLYRMDVSGAPLFLLITCSIASFLVIISAVFLCSWCYGNKDDDSSDEEDGEQLAEKYISVPPQDDGVRMLNKRSWEDRRTSKSAPALSRKTISILDGLLDRFERPGRNHQVVTEPVQPNLATHSSLHESLGSRSSTGSNYQTMTPTHKPLSQTNSKNSQSADDVNSSLWKGMRNIAFTLMDNAEDDAVDATPVDPAEGVDCQLGKIQFSISYDFQNLTLSLKILQATSLPAKDFTGTSDPYVKILLLPDKKHKLVTKVKKKNLNPRWNECFLFEGWPHNKLLEKTIYLQVIDYDRFSRDDPIGETYIPLNTIDLTMSPSMWRFLQPCKDSRGKLGEILLSLCYQPAVGRLTVIVMKCKDLKAKDITGASDPYVKLWLMYGNTRVEKKKTSIKMRTLNPVYNESFIYDIPWDKIREAAIEIIVMDFDKVGRNEMIGKILLSSKSGPLETRHWNDMITKPRQPVAQWHLLKD